MEEYRVYFKFNSYVVYKLMKQATEPTESWHSAQVSTMEMWDSSFITLVEALQYIDSKTAHDPKGVRIV